MTPSCIGIYFKIVRSFRNWGMPEWRGRKHEKLEPPRAIVCFYEDFNRANSPLTPQRAAYRMLREKMAGNCFFKKKDFIIQEDRAASHEEPGAVWV
jgi:hypothetical protein